MIGEDKLIHFSGVDMGEACTIVLRGASESWQLSILPQGAVESAVQTCLAFSNALHTAFVLGLGRK